MSALEPESGETKERAAARIDRALREGLTRRYGVPEGAAATTVVSAAGGEGVSGELLRETEALLAESRLSPLRAQLGITRPRSRRRPTEAARLLPRLF